MITRLPLALIAGLVVTGTAVHAAQVEPFGEREEPQAIPADGRFADAQASLRAGEPQLALPVFTGLAAEYPDNVDYALGRAQSLAALGQHSEALAELERGISLAPDYEALWALRFQLIASDSKLVRADELSALRAEAVRRFPDADWWAVRPVSNYSRQLTLALSSEDLSNDQPGWRSQSLRLDWAVSGALALFAEVDRRDRFSRTDLSLALGMRRQFADSWYAGGAIRSAGDADFSAQSDVTAFIGSELGGGWVAELQGRYLDYDTATVRTVAGLVEYYFDDFRLAYSVSVARLDGIETSVSHAAFFDWYPSEATRYGVSVFTGQEAESIAPGLVLETDTRGVGVYMRHQLTDRFAVRVSIGTSEQGDFYRRRYAGLAVTAGF